MLAITSIVTKRKRGPATLRLGRRLRWSLYLLGSGPGAGERNGCSDLHFMAAGRSGPWSSWGVVSRQELQGNAEALSLLFDQGAHAVLEERGFACEILLRLKCRVESFQERRLRLEVNPRVLFARGHVRLGCHRERSGATCFKGRLGDTSECILFSCKNARKNASVDNAPNPAIPCGRGEQKP